MMVYIVLALITTSLLYCYLNDNIDGKFLSIMGGMFFPITLVVIFFSLPIFIIDKIKKD